MSERMKMLIKVSVAMAKAFAAETENKVDDEIVKAIEALLVVFISKKE